jgi:hypothetical protein
MPRVIHFEKARQKIRDNKRHRYNAYDAYVHFLYQKKYKINSELSDLYMKYLGELKTWIEFKDGERNGQGTHTFSNGDKYVGEFKDGQQHGQGTYTYSNGDKYVGRFKDGKKIR